MKLTLTNGLRDIVITTESDDPDEVVVPRYEPKDELLMLYLGASLGYYGHLIDPMRVTSLDLYAAVSRLTVYDIKSIEGAPTAKALPEGAVS